MPEDDRLSLISPVGYSASTCGYCPPSGSGQRSKEKSSKSYGIWANNITPETYQQMLDRGWRRSGHYIYRPDCGYNRTCCPQIAIRISVDDFRPKADQKRAISALQSLVRQPAGLEEVALSTSGASRKGKYSQRWEAERQWKTIEWSEAEEQEWSLSKVEEQSDRVAMHKQIMRPIHQARSQAALLERRKKGKLGGHTTLPPLLGPKRRRFETTLRVADSTIEKYQLFRLYQTRVHGESEAKVSSKEGFERFLCNSPLMPFTPGQQEGEEVMAVAGQAVDVDSDRPIAYTLYHMEYRYQGRLVAVGVIDVLPRSISSVYLFYDPEYAFLQLGKISVVRELALVKQLRRKKGLEGVDFYNLGLYIHTCRKMRYKADYQPAEILDPLSCTWLAYHSIKTQLDRGVRYDFLRHPVTRPVPQTALSGVEVEAASEGEDEEEEEDDEDGNLPRPPPPGMLDPTSLSPQMLAHCLIFDQGRVNILIRSSAAKQPAQLQKVSECLAALGPIYNRFCLYL